jgi:hypothetical protein
MWWLLLSLWAGAQEPASVDRGFRNLVWGESLDMTSLRGTCKQRENVISCLDTIKDIPVQIDYDLDRGMLYALGIRPAQPEDHHRCPDLLGVLQAAYGKGRPDHPEHIIPWGDRGWYGTTFRANWSYNSYIPKCLFVLVHRVSFDKKKENENNANRAASQEDL